MRNNFLGIWFRYKHIIILSIAAIALGLYIVPIDHMFAAPGVEAKKNDKYVHVKLGPFDISTSNHGVSVQGPNGLNIDTGGHKVSVQGPNGLNVGTGGHGNGNGDNGGGSNTNNVASHKNSKDNKITNHVHISLPGLN